MAGSSPLLFFEKANSIMVFSLELADGWKSRRIRYGSRKGDEIGFPLSVKTDPLFRKYVSHGVSTFML
jgi:hypothetical protein